MKLTRANYHSLEANRIYMSNSQFKDFQKCEAESMAVLNNEWEREEKPCFLEGKYVHAWAEGKKAHEKFKQENKSIYLYDKPEKGLMKKFKHLDYIIEKIKNDELFMQSLRGGKEKIFTHEWHGVPWKIMIDKYFPKRGRFVDLKVLGKMNEFDWIFNKDTGQYEKRSVYEVYGYTLQMAVYCEIERLANKREDYFEPFLAVATKEKYPDINIIRFKIDDEQFQFWLSEKHMEVQNNIQRIIDVKHNGAKPERCEQCDYCKHTKVLKTSIHISNFTNE